MNPNYKEVKKQGHYGKYFYIDGYPFHKIRENEFRCKYYRTRGKRKEKSEFTYLSCHCKIL